MKNKFFVFAFVVMCTLITVPSIAQKPENNSGTRISSSNNNESFINMTEDGHSYKIRLNGTTVTEMEIDGKKIPESEFSKYDALIKKILKQVEEDRKQAALDGSRRKKTGHRLNSIVNKRKKTGSRLTKTGHRLNLIVNRQRKTGSRLIKTANRQNLTVYKLKKIV